MNEKKGIQTRPEERSLGRPTSTAGARFTPFSMMRRMMEDMDRLFGGEEAGPLEAWNPAVEVFQKAGKLVVRADLPGMAREDIRVHVDDGGLVVEGERKSEREEDREGYYHSERSYGSFRRRIPLPRGIDAQSCDARFDNGVLEVSLDLPKETKKQVEVRAGGAQKPVAAGEAGAGETRRNGPGSGARPH